ncbi:MAG TPA: HEAT repeat domain-containing protein [Ktedonobacterales bacterium]|jgi:HEAT repeat protein|nr:HEAT repeat domain-containing protein [Ktedonobacterales bacterium]
MDLLVQAFAAAVARFRAWADAYPPGERFDGWESAYGAWPELYGAFTTFVRANSWRQWNETTSQALLYAIARDNEMAELVKVVAENPDDLLHLAEQAVAFPDPDARWQIVVELSCLEPQPPQVEPLLLQFAQDEDEYVKRRALMALADVGSAQVADLVRRAWDTGDEYQRIAAIYALDVIGSPELDTYLARAQADGREQLFEYASRIRATDS